MANRIDWIMSFIKCATLMAPSTLKAVDGSDAAGVAACAEAGAGMEASVTPATGFWAEFMVRMQKGRTTRRHCRDQRTV